MDPLIAVDGLTRRFGAVTAVDAVSFTVAPGDIVALLGPNGAGKTTTLRLLAGLLTPSAGRVRIAGIDGATAPERLAARIGYLPEGAPLYGTMTPRGLLRFAARAHGLSGRAGRTARTRVVGLLGLADLLDRPIDTLSKGQRRRVAIAVALVSDPPVLILDEPTDGLDPNQKAALRQTLRDLAPGRALLVSTHLLEEVETLATRVMVMAGGRVVLDVGAAVMRALATDGRLDRVFADLTLGSAPPAASPAASYPAAASTPSVGRA